MSGMTTFMHVHLVALRYFAETVRTGSMRQAAEQLHISASAVNRQILKLEDQLRCKLFDRRSEGVSLTAAGEVLYSYAIAQERSLDRMISQIDELRGLRRGHITVASEDGVARDFLPKVVAGFHADFPRVTLDVQIVPGNDVLERVRAGGCDIGLGMIQPERNDVSVLAREEIPLGIISAIDHPLATKRMVRLTDLAPEAVIQIKDDKAGEPILSSQLATGWAKGGLIETNASDFVTNLVKAGVGIGVRSPVGILEDIASRRLSFTPIKDAPVSWPHLMIYGNPQRSMTTAAAVFLERLRADLPLFAARASTAHDMTSV